jgi:hypothetical protein
MRVVASLDEQALLSDQISTLRPLSAPQRERFAEWLGRRFVRAAHDDLITEQVLDPQPARSSPWSARPSPTQPPVGDLLPQAGSAVLLTSGSLVGTTS